MIDALDLTGHNNPSIQINKITYPDATQAKHVVYLMAYTVDAQ